MRVKLNNVKSLISQRTRFIHNKTKIDTNRENKNKGWRKREERAGEGQVEITKQINYLTPDSESHFCNVDLRIFTIPRYAAFLIVTVL